MTICTGCTPYTGSRVQLSEMEDSLTVGQLIKHWIFHVIISQRQHTHLIHNLYVLYCPATQFEIPQPCALVYFDTIPHNS
ncbi:MAG: hypothetical protein EZS28_039585 [Streblomastix strix]|uniref:Uncharacterized protein n=1 Tax=Streblomastix strix TaxID=222440 RepID=A0A5J4U3L5_9EUKA|nr:MAG: hypothetical protein EZS28_039585 [Streblomastix strix]